MKKHAGLASDVKGCALDAMKSGVLKITDSKLSKTINEAASSSMAAKNIKQTIWPEFTACSSKVGSNKNSHEGLSEQFMSCIDDLVKSTGSQLVQDKLSTTAAIRANFNKSDAAKIIAEKVQDFKACTEDQKKNNKRKDGMIDTSK
jgi:hypothetical protein